MYGTDFPYRTAADHTIGLTAFFNAADLKKIDRENALRLLPRWRETYSPAIRQFFTITIM